MDGEVLTPMEYEKDVGVTIQSNLKPSLHIANISRKANATLGMICRAMFFRNKKYFVGIYNRFVRPILETDSPAWSPWTKGAL